MKTKTEIVLEKSISGYNCAQAVFFTFSEDLHFNPDTALRLACGFGAGMGRKQEVCGAISGGILTLGLKFGRGEGQEKTVTEDTYQKILELMARFESKFGALRCKVLLDGIDLKTSEGQACFKENDLSNRICRKCMVTVVDIVEDILQVSL